MIWEYKKYVGLADGTDMTEIRETSIAVTIGVRMKEHQHFMMTDVMNGRRKNDSLSVQQV